MTAFIINTSNALCKNTSGVFSAFLFYFGIHSHLQAATMIFDTGFETGIFAGLVKHSVGGAIDIDTATATSPAASGNYFGKYDLQFGADSTGKSIGNYRSETYVDNRKGDFSFNTEYWFSLNYRYVDWVKDKSAEIAPFQIHRVPSKWKAGCGGEVSAYSNAPFLMFNQNDTTQIITYGGVVSWSGDTVKNQWQNIVFHFKITWDNTGYVEAWKDGNKLFRRDGKLHEQIDDCGKPFRNPRFHMGVYKWDWKPRRSATQSSRRTLFIDDLKIVQGSDGYKMVTSLPHSGMCHDSAFCQSSQEVGRGHQTTSKNQIESPTDQSSIKTKIPK